jgi:hypothetical protein
MHALLGLELARMEDSAGKVMNMGYYVFDSCLRRVGAAFNAIIL